jgi:hypothetical protein
VSPVEKARRELTRAMLGELAAKPEPVTVGLYRQEAHVDLVFSAEDVRAAAERQLLALEQEK